jgi:predicted component of type VI protein secretion system
VPVTARLSRKFYEALGEDIANELVDWFNAVDLTYRADLRELNELNFARFDAKLEQRIAQSESRLDAKIDGVETRLNARIDRVEAKLNARIDRVEAELSAKIDRGLADLRAELLKWMFLFWLGTVGPILALLWPIATR